jgi:hypothetical protein
MKDVQVKDNHTARAAEIVGSMSDDALQQSLIRDIALNLARFEAKGYEQATEDSAEGSVRVLRLLEYIYPSAKDAEQDMQHWQVQGVYRPSQGRLIRSIAMPMEVRG